MREMMAPRKARRPQQHRAASLGSPALRRGSNPRQWRRRAGRPAQGGDVEKDLSCRESSAKARDAKRRAASSSSASGIGGRLAAENLEFVAEEEERSASGGPWERCASRGRPWERRQRSDGSRGGGLGGPWARRARPLRAASAADRLRGDQHFLSENGGVSEGGTSPVNGLG